MEKTMENPNGRKRKMTTNKEEYTAPEMEVIIFESEDIVTSSPESGGDEGDWTPVH